MVLANFEDVLEYVLSVPSCPILKNVRIVLPLPLLKLSVRHRGKRASAREVEESEEYREASTRPREVDTQGFWYLKIILHA